MKGEDNNQSKREIIEYWRRIKGVEDRRGKFRDNENKGFLNVYEKQQQ